MTSDLKISQAKWLYLEGRPVLGILYGPHVIYFDRNINTKLLSLGLVYLGEDWKRVVPRQKIFGIEQEGFVRDVVLNVLLKKFIHAVDKERFRERTLKLPIYP